MRFRKDDPIELWMLTAEELEDAKNVVGSRTPNAIKFIDGDVISINARTRGHVAVTKLMRVVREQNEEEVRLRLSELALKRVYGELADIDTLKDALAEEKKLRLAAQKDRDDAIAAERSAKRRLELATAQPAIAEHARSTQR
jgi:hypothetical protein